MLCLPRLFLVFVQGNTGRPSSNAPPPLNWHHRVPLSQTTSKTFSWGRYTAALRYSILSSAASFARLDWGAEAEGGRTLAQCRHCSWNCFWSVLMLSHFLRLSLFLTFTSLNYCHTRKYNLTRKVFLNDQAICYRSNSWEKFELVLFDYCWWAPHCMRRLQPLAVSGPLLGTVRGRSHSLGFQLGDKFRTFLCPLKPCTALHHGSSNCTWALCHAVTVWILLFQVISGS